MRHLLFLLGRVFVSLPILLLLLHISFASLQTCLKRRSVKYIQRERERDREREIEREEELCQIYGIARKSHGAAWWCLHIAAAAAVNAGEVSIRRSCCCECWGNTSSPASMFLFVFVQHLCSFLQPSVLSLSLSLSLCCCHRGDTSTNNHDRFSVELVTSSPGELVILRID